MVVPFAAGGPTDAMARTIAAAAKASLGQPVIVENKGGAAGNIGAEMVVHAKADGYTILFGASGPLALNPLLYPNTRYDPVEGFTPIVQIGYLPNVLIVHPSVPATTVDELISYGRANPKKLSYGSSGAMSLLGGVLFNNTAKTDFSLIPYKGTAPALADLLGGQISMTFTDVLTAQPYIKSGKLRALGITTKERSQALPDVPTLVEQGMTDFDVSVFFGLVAPSKTPKEVIEKLNHAFADALNQPDVRKMLLSQGLEFAPSTSPEQLSTFIHNEISKWRPVMQMPGAKFVD